MNFQAVQNFESINKFEVSAGIIIKEEVERLKKEIEEKDKVLR